MLNKPAPTYFDYCATTPVDPRVVETMLPFFTEHFGNAESGQHAYGWKARAAVEKAREQVAQLIGATAHEITFTSGATESLYLAILGLLEAQSAKSHVISSQAEHKATLEACARAERLGHEVTLLPVNRYGQVAPDDVERAIRPNTALVTLMHANNEVGSMNPIAEIGQMLRARGGVAFHVDAAQTASKHVIDVGTFGIDLLSLSAHKFHGPKGIGALYVKRGAVHLTPLMAGGGQERGLRGGTHNVPGIVGLGRACEIALTELPIEQVRLIALRDRLIASVVRPEFGIELNGHPSDRLCNHVHLTLQGIGTDRLLSELSDFAFSTSSACSTGGASHVLKAMGVTTTDPLTATARFCLGRFTSESEVDRLAQSLVRLSRPSRQSR